MGDQGFGIDPTTITRIAKEIKGVHDLGVEIAIVVGVDEVVRRRVPVTQGVAELLVVRGLSDAEKDAEVLRRKVAGPPH